VDNLDVDEEGNIWVAGHPKLLTYVKHSKEPDHRAPSQVLRLVPESGSDDGETTFRVEEVYLDAGDELSASSIAARHESRLLIGAVFGDHFLDCQMRSPPPNRVSPAGRD
jgi:arylesterase/paraoxonase